MKVKVKKLHPDAKLPVYATDGAACFDLHALNGDHLVAGYSAEFETGLAFEVPEGHVMLIYSRSGHGFALNARLANCVGVIDSDYRGEVKVKLNRDAIDDSEGCGTQILAGDRIAQAMIVPIPKIEFVEADELSETERGEGGFGSTGTGSGVTSE